MKQETLIIKQGSPLSPFMRGLSIVMAVVCAVSVIGLPLALIFAAVPLIVAGTEFDKEQDRYREYTSLVGIRWGKWMPLNGFVAVTVLRVNRTSTMYSRSQQAQDFKEVHHDVVLLNATHRRKQVLKACDTREEAVTIAKLVADRTGFPLEQYAPQPIGPRRR